MRRELQEQMQGFGSRVGPCLFLSPLPSFSDKGQDLKSTLPPKMSLSLFCKENTTRDLQMIGKVGGSLLFGDLRDRPQNPRSNPTHWLLQVLKSVIGKLTGRSGLGFAFEIP